MNDPRSVNDIMGELETQKAELDLNLHSNAGVVETYKKRQAEAGIICLHICLLVTDTSLRSLLSRKRSRIRMNVWSG